MSGFTGNDGSELVGGLTPSGLIKAIAIDANGNIILSQLPGAVALTDGMSNPTTSLVGAMMMGWNGTNWGRLLNASYNNDGVNAGDNGVVTKSEIFLFNGQSWDRARGNQDNITLLASGAVSANGQSADQTNVNARGVKVYIATGAFGTGESTMTVTIQGKDPVSGQYFAILQSAQLSASGFVVLTVYPGIAAAANVSASDVLPRTWRVSFNATNWGTGGSTLGIACAYLV